MLEQTMIAKNIIKILKNIEAVKSKFQINKDVRLVAVSKTKTVEEIKQAYDAGMRHFGENYVDEIEEKQPKLPLDIQWHFIGHLQSNKIKKVIVSNLEYIQTIDRQSLAQKIQKYLAKSDPDRRIKVFIQIKTSEEESKNGLDPKQLGALYEFIRGKCPNLSFKGLMTIGKQGDVGAFIELVELKLKMIKEYPQLNEEQLELSMGMSGDYQAAIQHGSTSVRIGSSIFGARDYSKKQGKEESVNQIKK